MKRRRLNFSVLRRLIQLAALGLFLGLFFILAWPYDRASGAIRLSEPIPFESLLWLDPLSGISASIAARQWSISLFGAGAILLLSIIIPRAFCGYICPLGTLIGIFDWLIRRPLRFLRLRRPVRHVAHIRYYLLAFVLAAAACGVMLSGFVSPIPVLTRGLMFTAARLELGLRRNWSMVAPATAAMYVSVALFAVIFVLSIFTPRFWCRYVCPAGAMFSIANFGRFFERRINEECTHCDRCRRACPFDAINGDHTTRTLDCAFCRTCAGECPQDAITYVLRTARSEPSPRLSPKGRGGIPSPQPSPSGRGSAERPRPSRRALLTSAAAGAASAFAMPLAAKNAPRPLRPPGSVDEKHFLDLCVRCDECLKVCPGAMLRAAGLEHGLDALWTPVPDFLHAGCHAECNFCTLVCPTGAIKPLSIEQKRKFVMGIAVIDTSTCLAHRSDTECDPELSLRLGRPTTPCMQECMAAGYDAIRMQRISVQIGSIPEGVLSPEEIESMSHTNVAAVDAQKCVGCGLCEYRCQATIVKQRRRLTNRAISVLPK